MNQSDKDNKQLSKDKTDLGKLIKKIRTRNNTDAISMRKLAEAVEIPPSNMKYIEDGINAPSPAVYEKIIKHLHPSDKERAKLDRLYSAIRGTPPPDVCEIIINNKGMNNALRKISGHTLSEQQISELDAMLNSFAAKT